MREVMNVFKELIGSLNSLSPIGLAGLALLVALSVVLVVGGRKWIS